MMRKGASGAARRGAEETPIQHLEALQDRKREEKRGSIIRKTNTLVVMPKFGEFRSGTKGSKGFAIDTLN